MSVLSTLGGRLESLFPGELCQGMVDQHGLRQPLRTTIEIWADFSAFCLATFMIFLELEHTDLV
jgi:hypothetical protein